MLTNLCKKILCFFLFWRMRWILLYNIYLFFCIKLVIYWDILKMEQRHTIEYFHNQGLRPCQIFNQLKKFGMKRDMVYRTVKRLNETGSVADRTRSGRPASVVTKKMVASVRAWIIRNPAQSQRKLARALKTSKTSMRRIIREEIRLKPYKKSIVYGLTNAQKKKRHERTKKLIEVYARENWTK